MDRATLGRIVDSYFDAITSHDGSVALTSYGSFTWPGEAGPNGRVQLKGSDILVRAVVFQTFRTSVTINSISSTGK